MVSGKERITAAEHVKLLIRSFVNCNVMNKLIKENVVQIQFGELMVERGLRFVCLLRG
jgi:hypothetical protein